MNSEKKILDKIGSYYTEKLLQHGPSAKGVDWKNEETQEIRFDLLCQVFAGHDQFSVNDLGCGYGAFASYLVETKRPFASYYGYDISEEMIIESKRINSGLDKCHFIHGAQPDRHDFTVASGIMNVKLDVPAEEWAQTVIEMLEQMRASSSIGFAFNMLNPPTDEIYRREHLFYSDPLAYQKLCQDRFGSDVTILGHHQLFESTIIVKDLHA